MDVPSEVLEELKCSNCDMFLSSSPVYLQHDDGAGLCSQCFDPIRRATRNRQYESVARLFKFPCKYQEFGCTSLFPFADATHENTCNFRRFGCPVGDINNCNWLGTKDEMTAHCRAEHADLVVENSTVLKHDIRRSCDKTYLMLAFELLFLLHTKVCISTGKIFHAVRVLSDSAKATDFTFTLDIKRENCSLIRRGQVAPQDCLGIQEPISVVTDINSLLNILGDYSDTIFTVALERLKSVKEVVNCAKCRKNVLRLIYCVRNKWWCEECMPKKRKCQNKSKGCVYKDIDEKCTKHEWYYCQYGKKCRICDNSRIISEDSLSLHYYAVHRNLIHESDSFWHANVNKHKFPWLLIPSFAGTIMCSYFLDYSHFKLRVFIPVISDRLIEFRCTVRVARPGTTNSQTFTLEPVYTRWNDWYIIIKKDEFQWSNTGLDVSVDISEIKT